MKTLECYIILGEKDTTEGRGGVFETDIVFSDKQEAEDFANSTIWSKMFGVMGVSKGGPGYVRCKRINVYDTFEEWANSNSYTEEFEKEDIKNKKIKALSKLNYEEKRVLGLI